MDLRTLSLGGSAGASGVCHSERGPYMLKGTQTVRNRQLPSPMLRIEPSTSPSLPSLLSLPRPGRPETETYMYILIWIESRAPSNALHFKLRAPMLIHNNMPSLTIQTRHPLSPRDSPGYALQCDVRRVSPASRAHTEILSPSRR